MKTHLVMYGSARYTFCGLDRQHKPDLDVHKHDKVGGYWPRDEVCETCNRIAEAGGPQGRACDEAAFVLHRAYERRSR